MQLIAGVYGNSNRDDYLATKAVDHSGGSLKLTWFDDSVRSLQVPEEATKLTLTKIPEEFPRNVIKSRAGGGSVNTRIAAAFIADLLGEKREIRQLDAQDPEALVVSELPAPTRWLGLRKCPRNYVVGNRGDKRIFRSPTEAAAPLQPRHREDIAWLCEAETIVLNGPKDVEPVAAILAERDRRRFDLILVLTPALPVEFLQHVAIPIADTLIGAWDELQFLTGKSPVSVEGAAIAAVRLRRMAPQAQILVTMGKRGVLSMAAGSTEIIHVELSGRGGLAAEAQQIVRERPERLCGAGDALAGGVLMRRAFGLSLVSSPGVRRSRVADALAGCASALRWMGVTSPLSAGSFVIRSVPVAMAA